MSLETLPELVVHRICQFLCVNDLGRFKQTCRRLHAILPKLQKLVIKGENFDRFGPRSGHWCPEIWFNGPALPGRVRSITLSMRWRDQGYGNRKGRVWMQLMRSDEKLAEKMDIFGIASHEWEEVRAKIEDHDLLKLSKKGDSYRFMENTGGGGGHSLHVENFKVILIWESLSLDEEVPTLPRCESAKCSRKTFGKFGNNLMAKFSKKAHQNTEN